MNYKHVYLALKDLSEFLQQRNMPEGDKINKFVIEFHNALERGHVINHEKIEIMQSHLFDDFAWINTLNNYPFSKEDREKYDDLVNELSKAWDF